VKQGLAHLRNQAFLIFGDADPAFEPGTRLMVDTLH